MSLAKKIVVVGRIVDKMTGQQIRIPVRTAADIVHVTALAMGYSAEIAFSLGVISRSIPENKTGDLDVSEATARKVLKLAAIISEVRQTGVFPVDSNGSNTCDTILASAAHIRTIEDCYVNLVTDCPELVNTFAQQYEDWLCSDFHNAPAPETENEKVSVWQRFLRFIGTTSFGGL